MNAASKDVQGRNLASRETGIPGLQAREDVKAMITSEANAPWPLDQTLGNLVAAGLPAPSKVRFKLFTLDDRLVRGRLGRLDDGDGQAVAHALGRLLGNSRQS